MGESIGWKPVKKGLVIEKSWSNSVLLFYVPDFDTDSMARVLELITTGATNLDAVDANVYNGMLFIIDSFQININLEEIWSNAPTTKLKIQKEWKTSKMSNYVSRSTTYDSALFDSSSHRKDGIKKPYR